MKIMKDLQKKSRHKKAGEKMSKKCREELIIREQKRYLNSSKKQRSEMLDTLERQSGLSRKRVNMLVLYLSKKPKSYKERRGKSLYYDEKVGEVIKEVSKHFGFLCAENLRFCLIDRVDQLIKLGLINISQEIYNKLKRISVSSIKRVYKRYHISPENRTKPIVGRKISREIELCALNKDKQQERYIECDSVYHSGNNSRGEFARSIIFVDVEIGTTQVSSCLGGKMSRVNSCIYRNLKKFPYKIEYVNTDNGSEFINYHVQKTFVNHEIQTFRTRPYTKNDNAHVENRNRNYIRRLVGHARYDTEEQVKLLNQIFELECQLINYFRPTRKLIINTYNSITGKYIKRYSPPQTPYMRMMESKISEPEKANITRIKNSLCEFSLCRKLERLLNELFKTESLLKFR
jgi:hypothetical protein